MVRNGTSMVKLFGAEAANVTVKHLLRRYEQEA